MFTGIVECSVPVRSVQAAGSGARFVLPAPVAPAAAPVAPAAGPVAPAAGPAAAGGGLAPEPWRVVRGQSIAVSGACLTVVELLDPTSGEPVADETPGADMAFDLSSETLERTWLGGFLGGSARDGRRLNLERAMRLGERLDGHLVSGHVDGGGRIVSIEDSGDGGRLFGFEVAPGLERYLIEKGSVTIDGISLTVVEPAGGRFGVAVIPLTLELTNLGAAEVGDEVNIEVDQVGKWIERLLAARE